MRALSPTWRARLWSLLPVLTLIGLLVTTLALTQSRSTAIDQGTEEAHDAADGHFDAIVADTEHRIAESQREIELLLTGAALTGSDPATIAASLESLDVRSIGGLRSISLVSRSGQHQVIHAEPGMAPSGEELDLIGSQATSSRSMTATFSPLEEGDVVVVRSGIDGSELVAAFDAQAFLIEADGHDLHHVTTELIPPTPDSMPPGSADQDIPSTSGGEHEMSGEQHEMSGDEQDTDGARHQDGTKAIDPAQPDSGTGAGTGSDTGAGTSTSTDHLHDADDGSNLSLTPVAVFGDTWTLRVDAAPGFLSPPSSREIPVLLVTGTAISITLAALVAAAVRSRRRAEHERLAAEEALRSTEERFTVGFDGSPIGVVELDQRGVIIRANPAFDRMVGLDGETIAGRPYTDFATRDGNEDCLQRLRGSLSRPGTGIATEVGLRHRSGDEVWVSESASLAPAGSGSVHILVQLVDITEQRRVRGELQHRALHDHLTGLPNRTLLQDRLDQALSRARRAGGVVAAMFVDLDKFKSINDTAGHREGDRLLAAIAQRMKGAIRDVDTVARFGGDEFVVACDGLASGDEAHEVAERLRHAVAAPIEMAGRMISLTASIGIAVSDGHDDGEDLLREADLAMYGAKEQGRDRIVRFERAMQESLLIRLQLEDELRRAIQEGELRMHYQPFLDIEADEIVGFEALIRWEHPTRGLLSPADFLDCARDAGLITELDMCALRISLSDLARWSEADPRAAAWCLSVNASPENFADASYPSRVRSELADAGIDPRQLVIEVTEDAMLAHPDVAGDVLAQLQEIGVRIAVDDFGTGYSSLSQLASLKFDELKIDRSIIERLPLPDGAAIVGAIIQMASAMGLSIVAEGVETAYDLERLRELGSHRVQGYHISRPMPSTGVWDMLRDPAALRRIAGSGVGRT